MQRFLLSLLLLAVCANTASAVAKPFNRVLVLTGGSLEFGTYLGVLRGLQKEGWEPDLIVTTCGSSMVAALIQSYPTAQDAEDAFFHATFTKHSMAPPASTKARACAPFRAFTSKTIANAFPTSLAARFSMFRCQARYPHSRNRSTPFTLAS